MIHLMTHLSRRGTSGVVVDRGRYFVVVRLIVNGGTHGGLDGLIGDTCELLVMIFVDYMSWLWTICDGYVLYVMAVDYM